MRVSLRNTYQFLRDIGHVIIHRNLDSSDFFILDERKLVYASVAKSACSSIKTSMVGEFPGDRSIHYNTQHLSHKRIPRSKKPYFSFTYVRNPYDRLISCYKDKFVKKRGSFIYANYLFGYLSTDDSFEDFVRKVTRLPDFLCDRHFKSQSGIVFSRGARMDHIGRIEDLPGDFEDIRTRYGFAELGILNRSRQPGDEALLTEEVREMVYNRYRKDFEAFGYER